MKAKRKPGIVLPLIAVLLVGLALSACATKEPQQAQQEPIALEPSVEEQLQPVHPDEPVSDTFNNRFSLQNAITRLSLIEDLAGDLSGEQAMAFNNSVGALEGTLRKQDYQIAKLEFELAKHQYRDGHITREQLDEKASAYLKATEDFKSFWKIFGISD
jgi:hypothetical protein